MEASHSSRILARYRPRHQPSARRGSWHRCRVDPLFPSVLTQCEEGQRCGREGGKEDRQTPGGELRGFQWRAVAVPRGLDCFFPEQETASWVSRVPWRHTRELHLNCTIPGMPDGSMQPSRAVRIVSLGSMKGGALAALADGSLVSNYKITLDHICDRTQSLGEPPAPEPVARSSKRSAAVDRLISRAWSPSHGGGARSTSRVAYVL